MSRSIPEHKVHEVREATDILDLVSGYVTLKKRGRNHFGLCPFHQEKTPSFSVNPEKQIFHCFGCGVGGNVFTFMMQHEGVGFPEAVKVLAKRAGIDIEFEEYDDSAARQNEAIYYANEFAAKQYAEALFTTAGKDALAYLKKRGFSLEDIKRFGLGYAPPGWDFLLTHAQSEQIDTEVLSNAGLVLRKEGGGFYDRFRDRIIFPIWNLSGRVVAFGGRILHANDKSPKYINSPETAVYDKSKILYGLYQNRDAIRKSDFAIFVEGYMDALSLCSCEVTNVVATSGTSLTEEQARLILRYTNKVYLMYDSDTAGSTAALRGADVLLQNGLEVYIVGLPEGHDPDSFVREHGTDALHELVRKAKGLFDYKVEQVLQKPAEQRGEDIQTLLESLAKMKEPIQRSLLLTTAAEKLHISESVLWGELERLLAKRNQNEKRRSRMAQRLDDLGRVSKGSKFEKALDDLIRILLKDWSLADLVFNQLDDLENRTGEKVAILKYLKNQYKSGGIPNPEELVHRFNDVQLSSFLVQTSHENFEGMDLQRWAKDCIRTIKLEEIQQQLNQVRAEMQEAQKNGLPVKELLQFCMQLEEQKKSLQY